MGLSTSLHISHGIGTKLQGLFPLALVFLQKQCLSSSYRPLPVDRPLLFYLVNHSRFSTPPFLHPSKQCLPQQISTV